jgi:peroxiredoxin
MMRLWESVSMPRRDEKASQAKCGSFLLKHGPDGVDETTSHCRNKPAARDSVLLMKSSLIAISLAAILSWLAPVALHAALADAPESVHPLSKGTAAPSAQLRSIEGKDVELSSVMNGKPTILIFYRGGWCPFCNAHLAALGESYLELRKLGYQIVAISPDNLEALAGTTEKHHLLYKLFSDRAMRVSDAYGVAYRITAKTAAAYKENGIDLAPIPGQEDFWLPVPTAFIVGRDGVIKFVYYNPDPSVRISSQELIAAAKAATDPSPAK